MLCCLYLFGTLTLTSFIMFFSPGLPWCPQGPRGACCCPGVEFHHTIIHAVLLQALKFSLWNSTRCPKKSFHLLYHSNIFSTTTPRAEEESLHLHLLTLLKSASGQDTGVLQQMKVLSGTFLGHLVALSNIKLVRMGLPAQANATNIGCWTDGKGPQVWLRSSD